MFYVFSVLFFLLGLSTGIPALFLFRRMENIRKHSSTASGVVRSIGDYPGFLFGRSVRPLVAYRVEDTEHVAEMTDNSGFFNPRYQAGNTVEVVYHKETPWKAYLVTEWNYTRRDLWMAAGEIVLAGVLWGTGVYLGVPI